MGGLCDPVCCCSRFGLRGVPAIGSRNDGLLFIFELAAVWPHSANRRSIGNAALRQGWIVLAIVLLMLIKAKWASRVGKVEVADLAVWIGNYLLWVGHYAFKAFVYSYGYHLLELPATAWRAFKDYASAAMVIQATVIGIATFIKLYRSWDKFSDAVTASRTKMLIYVGSGIVLFLAGYSLYPINPAKDGINNRAAIAGTLGVAVSVAGLFGMLTSVVSGIWRKALFSVIVGSIAMSGALTIDVLAKFWVESYRLQNDFLSDIRSHIPVIPAGTRLILDGICPYDGPAPVFEAPWDLSSALSIVYGHPGIKANIVTRELAVEPNGLIVPSGMGPILYPFDQLIVYHFGHKKSYALPDAQAAL
jgi:hypothetical protein